MAVADFFSTAVDKVRELYNGFFYDGAEAPAPRRRDKKQSQREAQQPQAQQPYPYNQPQQQYMGYQPPYQQQPYQQQPYQQQAQPPVYQQAQQPVRNRRSQQHAAQQDMGKIVDFGLYQQAQTQQPETQPNDQDAQSQAPSLLTGRVINARTMADCRKAITLLRNGDAVVIVLENVTEPGEMRRLVDTLSGACYSLTASITKVSRYGVYLLAPQTLAVFTDQTTNAMNNGPVRQARPQYQQPYQAQRSAFGRQAPRQGSYYGQQSAYAAPQQNPYAPQQPAYDQQGFTQRSAVQEEAPMDFYQQPTPHPQAGASVGFSAQPASYGYAPDEAVAAEQ